MSNSQMADFNDLDAEQFTDNTISTDGTGKGFRKQAQGWLLTFAKQSPLQVPALTDEDKDGKPRGHHRRMYDHIVAICKKSGRSVQEFSIGWEPHDKKKPNYDPKRPYHWHVYFKTANGEPLNACSARFFDAPFLAQYDGSETHPNIRTAKKGIKDTIRIVRYTRKEGHWLSNMGDVADVGEKRSKDDLATDAFAVLQDETKTKQQRREEFNEMIKEADPLKYAYDGHRADATAMRILGANNKGKYDMEDFILPQVEADIYRGNRAKGMRPKCVVFLGPPRTGKTQFALAHFKDPIRINGESRAGLEALDKIAPTTDGIVIDDMDFCTDEKGNARGVAFTKSLLDVEEDAVIDGRYGRRTIPGGVPRMFCCNGLVPPFARAEDDPRAKFWSTETIKGHQAAIDDRIHIVRVPYKTYDPSRTNERKRRKLINSLVSTAVKNVLAQARAATVDAEDPSFW